MRLQEKRDYLLAKLLIEELDANDHLALYRWPWRRAIGKSNAIAATAKALQRLREVFGSSKGKVKL